MRLCPVLLGVIDSAALADQIDLDLAGVLDLFLNLLCHLSGNQLHSVVIYFLGIYHYAYLSACLNCKRLINATKSFCDLLDLFKSLEDGDNPYRASFVLSYSDGTDVDILTNDLYNINIQKSTQTEGGETQSRSIAPIDKVVSHADVAYSLENLRQAVSGALLIFMTVLFVVGIFIIINTVRLTVSMRSKEISVMRYVGAKGIYVTLPFVFEGVIMGLIATVIAYVIQWIVYSNICRAIVAAHNMINVLPFSQFAWILLLAFVLIGTVAGIIGSLISVAIYIKEE